MAVVVKSKEGSDATADSKARVEMLRAKIGTYLTERQSFQRGNTYLN